MMKSHLVKLLVDDLQELMPITELWSEDYVKDVRDYKFFEHCLINIAVKVGKLLSYVEMSDHYGVNGELGLKSKENDIQQELSYIIMSAFKAAKNFPTKPLPLSVSILNDLTRRGVIDDD